MFDLILHVAATWTWNVAEQRLWGDPGVGAPGWTAHRVTGLERGDRSLGHDRGWEIICLWHPKQWANTTQSWESAHSTSTTLVNWPTVTGTALHRKKQGWSLRSLGLNTWYALKWTPIPSCTYGTFFNSQNFCCCWNVAWGGHKGYIWDLQALTKREKQKQKGTPGK